MSLKGQKIVIIGGSSGMGLATSQALVRESATVFIASRSKEKLAAAKALVAGEVQTSSLDFTDESAVNKFFETTGRIDHLVMAAAGPPAWGKFLELDPAALRTAFNTKFWGYFNCARSAVAYLRDDGSIIFLTGGASRAAIPGTSGLAAVNGAITCMAYTLAKELAPLRVNVISPGLIDTPAYDWMTADEKQAFFEQMGGGLPVQRIGQSHEIGEAVLLLIRNGFITGAVLDVDGGARLT